jgi:general secretion pathway protein I
VDTTDHARASAASAAPSPTVDGPAGRTAASGFTLLEVLIAFLIAGIALTALFDTVLTGLRTARAASHYEQAVSRARSRLALAVHTNPLLPGTWQGDDGGGFNWRVQVTPIATTTVQPVYRPVTRMAANFGVTLYAVTVRIAWHDGGAREVRLDTEQIGQAAP